VPEEYLSLLYHLHTTDANICSAKFIPPSTKCITKKEDHLDELTNYFITTTGKQDLLIASNIYLRIEKKETPNTKNNIFAHEVIGILHYKITLYSYKLTLKQLKANVNEWTATYRDYLKNKSKGECFIDVFWKIWIFKSLFYQEISISLRIFKCSLLQIKSLVSNLTNIFFPRGNHSIISSSKANRHWSIVWIFFLTIRTFINSGVSLTLSASCFMEHLVSLFLCNSKGTSIWQLNG
jgi:hypothetical protein